MKRRMYKLVGMGLALSLCLSFTACGQASNNTETSTSQVVEATSVEKQETSSDEYLEALRGTYGELFSAMDLDENKTIWYQNFKDALGVEDETVAEQLRQTIVGMFSVEVYGAEAVSLAKENPGYGSFDCHFINGVASLKFDGDIISGYDASGNEIFKHTYKKLDDVKYDFGAMNESYKAYYTDETWPTMAIYESDGAEDDFKYFAFCGDTPEESFHIEFRYGKTTENLTAYYDGDYAYWLAAGFMQDAPDDMMSNCINLFVTENASGFSAIVEQLTNAQ